MPGAVKVLDGPVATKSLSRYFAVMQNKKTAKFKIAQKTPADFDRKDLLETFWRNQEKLSNEFHRTKQGIEAALSFDKPYAPEKSYSYLKLKIS